MASCTRRLASLRAAAARWTGGDMADAAAIGGAVIGHIVQGPFIDTDLDVDLYCAGLTRLSR